MKYLEIYLKDILNFPSELLRYIPLKYLLFYFFCSLNLGVVFISNDNLSAYFEISQADLKNALS